MQNSILKSGDARVQPVPVRNLLAPDEEAQGSASKPACETRVETLTENGCVIALEIHCSCGEVTRVSLEYSEASPEAS